jgi:hypothetical protein
MKLLFPRKIQAGINYQACNVIICPKTCVVLSGFYAVVESLWAAPIIHFENLHYPLFWNGNKLHHWRLLTTGNIYVSKFIMKIVRSFQSCTPDMQLGWLVFWKVDERGKRKRIHRENRNTCEILDEKAEYNKTTWHSADGVIIFKCIIIIIIII